MLTTTVVTITLKRIQLAKRRKKKKPVTEEIETTEVKEEKELVD